MTEDHSAAANAVEKILGGELLAIVSDTEKQSPSELPSDTSTQYDQVTATKAAYNKEK